MTMIYALLGILFVLLVIDWRQTLRIARNPDRWHERNRALGAHPSVSRVNAWFALCAVGVVALLLLPTGIATVLCFLWIVAEAWCVVNNDDIGLDD